MEDMIKAALPKLDATKNADWTEDGRPSLTRMRQLIKDNTLTQEVLDQFTADVRRPKFELTDGKTIKPAPDLAAIDEAKKNHVIDQMMVAINTGYASGAVRNPGEVFLFSGIKGSWMREESAEEQKARLKAIRESV